MANDNLARGLVPLQYPKVPGHYYRVSTGTDLYLGMPVAIDATGYITPVAVGSLGAVVSIGVLGGFAGTLKRGVATANPYLKVADVTPPVPASDTGDRFAFVWDEPSEEFVVQADTGGTLAGLADVGNAAVLLYRSTSGNTTSGWANLEMDADSNVASGSGIIQILRLHDVVNADGTDNAAAANYTKWVVRLLNHQKRGGALNVAV